MTLVSREPERELFTGGCGFLMFCDDTREDMSFIAQAVNRPVTDILFYIIIASIIAFYTYGIIGWIILKIRDKLDRKKANML